MLEMEIFEIEEKLLSLINVTHEIIESLILFING